MNALSRKGMLFSEDNVYAIFWPLARCDELFKDALAFYFFLFALTVLI